MKSMLSKLGLLLVAALASGGVAAQCGAGIPSGGNPNCIPPEVYHGQGITQPQMTAPVQQPIIIQHKWADRWGAIIHDQVNPVIGVSQGLASKEQAIAVATADCRSNGGGQCSDPFIFHNQCAALVAVKGGGGYSASDVSEEKALNRAMNMCKKNQVCIPYYSTCSHAEAVPIR